MSSAHGAERGGGHGDDHGADHAPKADHGGGHGADHGEAHAPKAEKKAAPKAAAAHASEHATEAPVEPKPNYLSSTLGKALDSMLSLASTKSPINLSPLQLAYDLSGRTAKRLGEWFSPFGDAIKKTRDTILGLFGGAGGGSHGAAHGGGGGHH